VKLCVVRLLILIRQNGPTRHSPQAPTVQHHIEPAEGGEDPWGEARRPSHQKACRE